MFWEKALLFLKRHSLKKELELFKTLRKAKGFLIHLSEENTLFDISSIAVLRNCYKKAHFWAVTKGSKEPLLRCVSLFDKVLFYENYKEITTHIKEYHPQVFIDFNHPGSIRFALASGSDLRCGFYAKSAFPYFNLLVKDSKREDDLYRSFSLIAPFVGKAKPKEITLKLSPKIKEKAISWLKMKGYKKGKPLVIIDHRIFGGLREFLQNRVQGLILNGGEIGKEILPGVVFLSNYFIGGSGLLFELSIGLKRQSLLLKDLSHLRYKEIEEFLK